MKLDRRSPVLEKLAELYAASTAGSTGVTTRDFGLPFLKLIEAAKASLAYQSKSVS